MPERKGNPSSGGVRIEIEDGVAVVTIDRPEVRNAIGFATVDELDAALDRCRAIRCRRTRAARWRRPRVRVGRRPQGARRDPHARGRSRDGELASRRVLDRVAALPIPVIAALNGHALGGGAEVAIAADIRIAADDVKIGFNQVALGIMPAWGGAERLAQARGPRVVRCWRSRPASSTTPATAQRLGLVDIVVPRADVRRRVAGARAPDGGVGTGDDACREVGHRRGRAHVSPRARSGRRRDAFAQLWTADAHWAAVDAFEQKRRTG